MQRDSGTGAAAHLTTAEMYKAVGCSAAICNKPFFCQMHTSVKEKGGFFGTELYFRQLRKCIRRWVAALQYVTNAFFCQKHTSEKEKGGVFGTKLYYILDSCGNV